VRRTTLVAAAVAATVLLAAGLPATARPQGAAGAQHYIVVLQESAAASTVAKLHAATYGLELGHVYRSALKGYSAPMTAGVASALEALPIVRWVEPDREVRTFAQTVPTGVNRADADLSPTAAIDGTDQRVNVDVAVIDTGVDLDHPDLNVHTAGAKNCSLFGLVPSADDDNGHGSHVAGTTVRWTTR
jgi:subtilisin